MRQWELRLGSYRNAFCALIIVLAFSVGSAYAGSVSSVFFQVDVSSSLGTESWSINSTEVNYDPVSHTWNWSGAGIGLGEIATLNQANLMVIGDPQIAMGFAITAGAADTTVTITSATLNFSALSNPTAAASAGLTLTQTGGSPDAFLTGLGGDTGSAFAAYYNVPPGTVFGEYVSGLTTTTTISGSGSSGGFVMIPGSVSSMQTVYSFVLSAGDQASGTSNFLLVPEPATLVLLACGLLFARRR